MKNKNLGGWRWVCAVLIALLVQPWGAYRVLAADITPGYTFTSGEANVTHTKLNNSAAGTINTTFYSGKSSAGSDPNTAFEILLRDTSLDVFKRTTLGAGFFDHSALLNSRTAKTAPVVGDSVMISDSAAGNAYKQMTWSNWMFAGASTAIPTNETLLPALRGGAAGSLSLSNLIGGATAHNLPTNGDAILMLTANGGREVKQATLETIFKSQTAASNFSGTDIVVSWDGTRLRGNRATNLIDGLTVTNTAPKTSAALTVLEDGALKKLFYDTLRQAVAAYTLNVTQSVYSVATNIAGSSGNWSTVADIGASSLTATLVPKGTNAAIKVLVRVVFQGTSQGGGDNGYLRVLRGGNVIGVGDDDGGSRVEAGASIGNDSNASTTTYEFLDTTGPTNTVYAVQVGGVTGNTLYINRDSSDAASTANGRFISTITLQEVHQ